MNDFTLIEQRPTKWVYKLANPVEQRYLSEPYPSTVWATRSVDRVVVSLGNMGDSAIFPATDDGRILDFDSFHDSGYWITDPDEFMREWLSATENEGETK